MRHGAALARADLKEPVAQGEATEAATKQAGEEAPTPRDARALESGEAEAPSITEATEGEAEAPRTSEAEVAEAGASRASKAEVADVGAPRTTEAEVAEGKEVADAEAASTAEQPALTSGEGSSALVRAAPLAARIQELEEELTWVAGEWDTFRSRAEQEAASTKAIVEQLEEEQGAHLLTKGLKKEVSQAAEASVAVQAVLEAKIWEHNALWSAARTACEALEVEGVESGSSLGSRLIALSGRVHERLRGALHMGVKRALAVVSSHYVGIDLEAVNDGYVVSEDDEKAEEVMKLVEAVEAPGTALASDDGVRNPERVDDISEEQHRLLGFYSSDRTSLNPLGELVNSYQQMGIAPEGLLQRPNHV
ncbi:uncharacterized protein [Miscanthus floridulus]|uniref:uncharacterized protein n=1 Tax=Miscanthus floridulus TaxID=154761 RepID=UPI0034592BB7